MALAGQVSGRIIGSFAGNGFAPLGKQVSPLVGGQELIGDDQAEQAVIVIAPLDVGNGTGSDAADGVGTTLGGIRNHHGAVEQRGFRLRIQDEPFIVGRSGFGGLHQLVIVTQQFEIDLFIFGAFVSHIFCGNGGDTQNHAESHQQGNQFLHGRYLLFFIYYRDSPRIIQNRKYGMQIHISQWQHIQPLFMCEIE